MGSKTWLLTILMSQVISYISAFNVTYINDAWDMEIWPAGLVFDSTCGQQQLREIESAIPQVIEMLEAGRDAVNLDRDLFRFFFRPGNERTVRRAFVRLLRIIEAETDISMVFNCDKPHRKSCEGTNGQATILGAALVDNRFIKGKLLQGVMSRNNMILICQRLQSYPDYSADPCNIASLDVEVPDPGRPTKGPIYLHEMLHLPYLVKPNIRTLQDYAAGPFEAHALTDPEGFGVQYRPIPTEEEISTTSIQNYVYFCYWAWLQSKQRQACPKVYPLWKITKFYQPRQRDELRRLLSTDVTTEVSYSDVFNISSVRVSGPMDENATFRTVNVSGMTVHEVSNYNFSNVVVDADPIADPVTINWYPLSVAPLSTTSQLAETPAPQCGGSCTSIFQGCTGATSDECKCVAPHVGFSVWFTGGCVRVVKAPSSSSNNPRDLSSSSNVTNSNSNSSPSVDSLTPPPDASAAPPPSQAIYELDGYFYNISTHLKVACPCNSTCVSAGCCGTSDDGMIWQLKDSCQGRVWQTELSNSL